jgi:hypothetical protein
MHSYRTPLAFVALLVSLSGFVACGSEHSTPVSPASANGKYPIALRRELEPGKSYHLRVKDESTEHMVTRVRGQVNEETKTTVLSFVGAQQALAAGRDQPTDYVVEQLTRTQNGTESVLLPAGAKIACRADGKHWQYTVDGQLASEELANALKTLLGDSIGGPTDDEIFGTNQPRAIGESWPVDVSHLPGDDNV